MTRGYLLAFSLFAMYLKRLSDDKAAVCVGGGRGGREGGRLTMRRVATASMNFSSVLLIEIYIIELPKLYRREEEDEEEEKK